MPQSMPLLGFADISRVLDAMHAPTTASEIHGILTGFVCAGFRVDGQAWVELVLGEVELSSFEKNKSMLIDLYNETCEQLNQVTPRIHLLLPTDEQSLEFRARALSRWCQGFLAGLGLGGLQLTENQTEETQDILTRFVRIARLDHQLLKVNEDDEASYQEVSAYVQQSVLQVYVELAGLRDQKTKLH
jgi:yecA family protein